MTNPLTHGLSAAAVLATVPNRTDAVLMRLLWAGSLIAFGTAVSYLGVAIETPGEWWTLVGIAQVAAATGLVVLLTHITDHSGGEHR